MRIVETGLARTAGVRRNDRRGGIAGGFDGLLETDETRPAPSAGSVASLVSVSALWALQTVEDAATGRSRGLDHGRELLDDLEGLQRDLTLGTGSVAKLQQIAARVQGASAKAADDPQLAAMIDEIELRVAVELAKRGCFI